MARFPLVLPALALVAGVLGERAGVALAALIVASALGLLHRQRLSSAAIALAAGIVLGALHGHPRSIDHESRIGVYSGNVSGDVRCTPNVCTFPLTLADGTTVRATLRERIAIGERLELGGRLAPFDLPRNPGEIDQRAFEAARGYAGELQVARLVARDGFAPWSVPLVLARLRAAASSYLRKAITEPNASILAGALYGERGTIPHDLHDDFQATGTVHILVTAGLHLGIVAATVLAALRLLRVPRATTSLLAVAIVWAYAAFSGDHLPSIRAATMISVVLLGRAIGARAATGNAIAAAAIVIAVLLTPDIGSTSFLLSLSCVTAIVLFAEHISHGIARTPFVPGPIAEALALTIATQIGVLPLTLATFFTLAPYAVLANALVVPLTGIAMVGGWCVLLAAPIQPLAQGIAPVESQIVGAIVAIVTHVAALPGSRVVITPPPWPAVIADFALVGLAAFLLWHKCPRSAAIAIACGMVCVIFAPRTLPQQSARITMLDVGQGDAILVQSASGRAILIDTGGRLERGLTEDGNSPAEAVGERIVVPTLLRLGVTRLDAIILTHPHGDHAGGLAPILRTLSVGLILDSGQVYGGRAYNDGVSESRRKHVPIVIARCGDRLSLDEIHVAILSPCTLATGGKNDVNENSIVARVDVGRTRLLFMGDAGEPTESRLVAQYADIEADVLKVGHHGSAYASSSAFLSVVDPKFAFISVGRHNLFGHPAKSTLASLSRTNTRVFRTDMCGAIKLEIKTNGFSTALRCSDR